MHIFIEDDSKLKTFADTLTRIEQQLDALGVATTMALTDLNAAVARIGKGLDNIAADIRTLSSQINPGGLTAAEATALQTSLEAMAVRTESIAAETPDLPAA